MNPETPPWLRDLAEFDSIDTLIILGSFPLVYALWGLTGLFLAGLAFIAQAILRKTPLLSYLATSLYSRLAASLPASLPQLPSPLRTAYPDDHVQVWLDEVEKQL